MSDGIYTVDAAAAEIERLLGSGVESVLNDITFGQFYPAKSLVHKWTRDLKWC